MRIRHDHITLRVSSFHAVCLSLRRYIPPRKSALFEAAVVAFVLVLVTPWAAAAQGGGSIYLPLMVAPQPEEAPGNPAPQPEPEPGAGENEMLVFLCRGADVPTGAVCGLDANNEAMVVYSDMSSHAASVQWINGRTQLLIQVDTEWIIVDADGANPTPLDPSPSSLAPDMVFGPDATFAVYSKGFPARELYLVTLAGTPSERKLTDTPGFSESNPAVSPDGTKIVYIKTPIGSENLPLNLQAELWIMDLQTETATLLQTGGMFNTMDWSSTGKIAYSRTEYTEGEQSDNIYVIDASGGGATQVSSSSRIDQFPTWSPDGTQIAVVSVRREMPSGIDEGLPFATSYYRIETMNADGTERHAVTAEEDYTMVSRPDW